MSLRTVLNYAISSILIVLAIGPASAQAPNPWRVHTAPMPRMAPRIIIQSEEEVFQVEGQLRITPMPVAPLTLGPVPQAITQGFGTARQAANNPFSVQFFCNPPAAQLSSACNDTTYTWAYNLSLPQRLVVVPRMIDRLDCGLLTPCPVEAGGPGITVAACLPNELSEWPYPLPLARAVCRDGPGGWWLDATPVPQPVHAMPVVIVQQVRERGPAIVADVRNFGFRVVNECPGPVRCNALSAVGETSRSCCQSEPAECCEKDGKLSGTWYRDLDGVVISATFAADELKLCMTQNAEGTIAHMTLTAHYAVTKEGMVHGVITGVDVDVKSISAEGSARATTAMTEGMAEMQKLVDCPFSFRVKSTSIGVMVSNLRVAVDGMNSKEMAILCGMFQHAADGKVPTPRVMKTYSTGSVRCIGSDCSGPAPVPVNVSPPPCMPPMTMPTPVVPAGYALPGETSSVVSNPKLASVLGADEIIIDGILTPPMRQYLHQQPQLLPPGSQPQLMRGAVEVVKLLPTGGCTGAGCFWSIPPLYSPARPANVPRGDFGMMSEVFGQMLSAKTQPWTAPGIVAPPVVTTAPVPPMAIPTPPRSESPR